MNARNSKACSALKNGEAPNGIAGRYCQHGHAITTPCLGINADTLVPVCTKEDRYFDEQKLVVHLYYWLGA